MNMSKYKIMSFEVEKNEILDNTFQVILTIKIEIIMNNEIKKLSRNRKRRIERRIERNDDMKLLFKKINLKRKSRIKILIKLNN